MKFTLSTIPTIGKSAYRLAEIVKNRTSGCKSLYTTDLFNLQESIAMISGRIRRSFLRSFRLVVYKTYSPGTLFSQKHQLLRSIINKNCCCLQCGFFYGGGGRGSLLSTAKIQRVYGLGRGGKCEICRQPSTALFSVTRWDSFRSSRTAIYQDVGKIIGRGSGIEPYLRDEDCDYVRKFRLPFLNLFWRKKLKSHIGVAPKVFAD